MAISQAVNDIGQALVLAGRKDGRLEAELLAAHVLNKDRVFVLAHGEQELTRVQERKLYKLFIQLKQGAPPAYLLGYKEFHGRKFYVNKDVLVPRPESELMVEEALNLATRDSRLATIVDVGTGSGCLIISVAKELENLGINKVAYFAADISGKALAMARRNAKLNKVAGIKFKKGNLLEPYIEEIKKLRNLEIGNSLEIRNWKLVIMANLPYLTPRQISHSPTIQQEPRLALDGGKDGLKYYRALFKQLKGVMRYELCVTSYALCEIDPSQKRSMVRLAKGFFPRSPVQIKKDLKGHSRLAVINIPPQFPAGPPPPRSCRG